ncbi:MAG: hypothetical protein M1536_02740 [Firmicutes bacterium]|nr:hypothetical protein [Bacillota bacterium]
MQGQEESVCERTLEGRWKFEISVNPAIPFKHTRKVMLYQMANIRGKEIILEQIIMSTTRYLLVADLSQVYDKMNPLLEGFFIKDKKGGKHLLEKVSLLPGAEVWAFEPCDIDINKIIQNIIIDKL